MPVAGGLWKARARSAARLMVVGSGKELLFGFRSNSNADTVAVFVTTPFVRARAVIVTVAEPPLVRSTKLKVIRPLLVS